MVKRMLTLTLIGLMTAMLFPVCANAQVQPANLTVVQTDDYHATPTLEWTCVSGPTIFKVTVKDKDDVAIVDAETVDAGILTDGKWDRTGIDVLEGETDTYMYGYSLSLTDPGTYSWEVVAEREDEKTTKTDGYVADPVAGDAITLVGDITLSLGTLDPTAIETGASATLSVSMDNTGISVDTVTFSVAYNADVLSPADPPYETTTRTEGLTAEVTPSGSGDAAKVMVELTGNIAEGTGEIIKLLFTADVAGTNTFAINETDIAITSVAVPSPSGTNPAVVGGESQTLTVTPLVDRGDLDGNDAVELADAVIALQILAGMTTTADVSAHTAAHGAPDIGLVVYILKTILAG